MTCTIYILAPQSRKAFWRRNEKLEYASNNYSVRKELESYGNFIRWADFIVKSSSEI